jgi:hypothetical protein
MAPWKAGILVASAMVLLALVPQLTLWHALGRQWNGSYAGTSGDDEYAYSAYVNALIQGRPRRNDPYTGQANPRSSPPPESIFSVQFIPAYAIALPARGLGVSAATSFIAVTVLATFFTALAIFWLLMEFWKDQRMAACGVLVVLCLGSLTPVLIVIRVLQKFFDPATSLRGDYILFGFTRRYVPAVPLALFFVFCVLVLRIVASEKQKPIVIHSILAGVVFNLLVFSYFYLWTSAVAWLFVVGVLWLIARPKGWIEALKSLGIITAIASAGMIAFSVLLGHRPGYMDTAQALNQTHAPDLLRASEVLGGITILGFGLGVFRNRIAWKSPESLLTAAFALTPFVVFNQQVLTGYSLQPFHYDAFIANYLALMSAIITLSLIWRERPKAVSPRLSSALLLLVGLLAFGAGYFEIYRSYQWQHDNNVKKDGMVPVAQRLAEIAKRSPDENESGALVFASQGTLADLLPTFAPQAVLWAPAMLVFTGAEPEQIRERYFQQLYYSEVDESQFRSILESTGGFSRETVFGADRVQPLLGGKYDPITAGEVEEATKEYAQYIASFSREAAYRTPLSYVITPNKYPGAFLNLDRWYQREKVDQVGDYTLYRVHLRP